MRRSQHTRERIVHVPGLPFQRDTVLAIADGVNPLHIELAKERIRMGILPDESETPAWFDEEGSPVYPFPFHGGWTLFFSVETPPVRTARFCATDILVLSTSFLPFNQMIENQHTTFTLNRKGRK